MNLARLSLASVLSLIPIGPLHAQGACAWQNVGGGVNGTLNAACVYDDGGGPDLYVGGAFVSAGSIATTGIARWDGQEWSDVGGGIQGQVNALAVFDDGTGSHLFAGGSFSVAGGVNAFSIARWNGTSWSPLSTGTDGVVLALQVFEDELYVAGTFSMVQGMPVGRIARWSPGWLDVEGGVAGTSVRALTVFDDGSGPKLYVGGSFTQLVSEFGNYNNIARFDGAEWSSLQGGGFDNSVHALAAHDDGSGPKLYAGGSFSSIFSPPKVAVWDGVQWGALSGSGSSGSVDALSVYDDGTGAALYIGGGFTTIGGWPSDNLTRWDGSTLSGVGSGPNGGVKAMAVFDNGSGPALLVAGGFGGAPGVASGSVIAWECGGSIEVSFSQPGGPGAPVFVSNANLLAGNEYFNFVSLQPCPGGPGSGPLLGLCSSDLTFLLNQLALPVGSEPFHVLAPQSSFTMGPFQAPPLTLEAVCVGFGAAGFSPVSPVTQFVVQ